MGISHWYIRGVPAILQDCELAQLIMIFREHDVVELIDPEPTGLVKVGTQGTIVHCYDDNIHFAVEFPPERDAIILDLSFDKLKMVESRDDRLARISKEIIERFDDTFRKLAE